MNAKRVLSFFMIAAVMVSLAVALISFDNSSVEAAKGKELVGTWLLTITPSGEDAPPPFVGFYSFFEDGNVLFSSAGPPIPALGNPGHGVWAKLSKNTFGVTFMQNTYDETLQTNGTLKVSAIVTINGEDELTTVDTVKIFDTEGNEIVTLEGATRGVRMRVEQ